MKKIFLILLLPISILFSIDKPKLVVVISIDQFRYDYLERFSSFYGDGGFNLFKKNGANYSNTNYLHSATETGPGHAVILSGSYGMVNGIIANQWYDTKQNKEIYCVDDVAVKIINSNKKIGSSPKLFIGTTVGDQLRESNNFQSKVISISNKDRAAILMGGKNPTSVYFFASNDSSGFFSSSTYYTSSLPNWVDEFNKNENVFNYKGKVWEKILPESNYNIQGPDDFFAENPVSGMDRTFPHTIDGGKNSNIQKFGIALLNSPFATEHLLKFASSAIINENLGKNNFTDLLAISISANDYVGHSYGPNSHEVMDLAIRTDKMLSDFFKFIDSKIGLKNCLIVLTADHGVSPLPEFILSKNKDADAGRIAYETILEAIEKKLNSTFGESLNRKWIKKIIGGNIYLNDTLVAEKKLLMNFVEEVAKDTLQMLKGIAAVQTYTSLKNFSNSDFYFSKAKLNFIENRSGNLFVQLKPFFTFEWNKNLSSHGTGFGASHGEIWNYDSHVPLLWYWSGIKKGNFSRQVSVSDIAPTLSYILKIEPPVGNQGKVLKELFEK